MSGPVTAWFDCSAGAAGDMLLGALVDAGASPAAVQRAVDAVVPGVRIRTERVRRRGLAATKVHVETEPGPPHRTWHDIRALLAAAALPGPVRDAAQGVFARLARAEAAVHGIPVDDVHFHEVGALDAIADVVGVCAAHHDLGVVVATATPLVLGAGRTSSAHGRIPVPVPAVLRLLADAGAPAASGGFRYEMCTPTGAALVLSLCSGWGDLPPLELFATGAGAGTRDLPEVPNVVRVVLGRPSAAPRPGTGTVADGATAEPDGATAADGGTAVAEAVVLEANVDDLDPRIWPHVLDRLLEAGASDAWLTPVLMKKGRPAHTLSVLCSPELLPALRGTVLAETSTIGFREHRVAKHEAAREFRTVTVDGIAVQVKIARHGGRIVNVQPEYREVAEAAARLGLPVKTALARAVAAAGDGAES